MYDFLSVVALMALMAAWSVDAADVVEISESVVSDGSAGTIMSGQGTVAVAPTEAQAEQAYQQARQSFLAVAKGTPDEKTGDVDQPNVGPEDTVAGTNKAKNISLEDVKVVLDVENVTLREVMTQIVSQAAQYTGPWTVKWRLKPENMDIMEERVNLTAEDNFGEFCSLLVERLKNMSGTQLYVTAFAGTRVLLVTDTYY